MRQERRAFSLVELLVVVAVISILAMIMAPSLQRAKELTRRAICLSNQRNTGIGFAAYASEHDQFLPQVGWNAAPALPNAREADPTKTRATRSGPCQVVTTNARGLSELHLHASRAGMSDEAANFRAIGRVPQLRRLVMGSGEHLRTVWGEDHGPHRF